MTVPRGKAKFYATSPKHDDWPGDPERALREIAEANGAEYINDSLTFSANGRIGYALFRTFEPDSDDSRVTNFVTLAEALDAIDFNVGIDAERWQRNMEAES
jgi:hypothetical protein